MPDLERTLELAKRGKYSRSELFAGISAMAEERRQPGESEAQAFTKFVSTPEGSELFQIQKSLPGRDIDTAWTSPVVKSAPNDWEGLVSNLMKLQKCSRNKAIDAALSSEAGRHLFKMQKRSEQVASGHFTTDDMKVLDGADAELQAHGDLRKRANQHMSEYEHLVADAMQKYPDMTESDAGDHVRSTPNGAAAWTRHKGQPGKNGAKPIAVSQGESMHTGGPDHPNVPTTSGRTPPARSPLWESAHSGSGPAVTPARAPGAGNALPAIKAWNDLKAKAMFDYGYSEERTVEILKLLPAGKAAIERVIEAAKAAVARS